MDIGDEVFQSWQELIELESRGGSEAFGVYGQTGEGFLEVSVSTLVVLVDNTKEIPPVKHILYWSPKLLAGVDRFDRFSDDSALPIVIMAMLTYAERFLCGVKKTWRPGEALDTKGAIEG